MEAFLFYFRQYVLHWEKNKCHTTPYKPGKHNAGTPPLEPRSRTHSEVPHCRTMCRQCRTAPPSEAP
jgi:hypothetical protein